MITDKDRLTPPNPDYPRIPEGSEERLTMRAPRTETSYPTANLFPTPMMKLSLDRNFTKDELQLLLTDLPMFKDKETGMSNHRSKDLYLFDNFVEELKDIKNFCERQLKYYLEEIDGADTDLATLRITQSWLNRTKPQERHHAHFHINSYLSGVLYIKCLPNDYIMLDSRRLQSYNNLEFPRKKITPWNAEVWAMDVKEGELILFPSWVPHYVDPNETDMDRVSFSFNTFPIGEMGNYHGSHLKL